MLERKAEETEQVKGIGSCNLRFVDNTPVAMPIKEQPLVGPNGLLPTAAEDADAEAAAESAADVAAEAAAALSPAA